MSGPKLVGAPAHAMILSAACACGDVGDVRVPLIPDSTPPRSVPMFTRGRARAFTDVSIGGEVAACPLDFHSLLPSAPPDRSSSGAGHRVVDGDGTRIECLVRQRLDAPEVFEVDLVMEHADVPRLTVQGSMSEERVERVALQIITPDDRHVEGECSAAAFTLRPGAVSFRLPNCLGQADSDISTRCSIEVVATFENCSR